MIYNSSYKELFVSAKENQPHHGINVNRLRLDYDVVEKLPDWVNGFIDVCNLYSFDRDWEYTYLDIESRFIKAGFPTCNNLWHVDGFPHQEAEDVQAFLFVDKFPTEFLLGEVEASGSNTREFNNSVNNSIKGGKIVTVPPSVIIQYDGHGIHRGVFADQDGWRTRYRLVKSNIKFNDTKGIECLDF